MYNIRKNKSHGNNCPKWQAGKQIDSVYGYYIWEMGKGSGKVSLTLNILKQICTSLKI